MNLEERIKRLEEKIFGTDTEDKWKPEDTIKSKLANVEIASNDYWESSEEDSEMVVDGKKIYFTFDEAVEIEKKLGNGWRLPTRHEWSLICEEFANDQNTGELCPAMLGKKLELNKNGYIDDDSIEGSDSDAFYWSSTAFSSNFAYNLDFNSGNVNPTFSLSRLYGFSVRLVRDLKESQIEDE